MAQNVARLPCFKVATFSQCPPTACCLPPGIPYYVPHRPTKPTWRMRTVLLKRITYSNRATLFFFLSQYSDTHTYYKISKKENMNLEKPEKHRSQGRGITPTGFSAAERRKYLRVVKMMLTRYTGSGNSQVLMHCFIYHALCLPINSVSVC